MNYANLKTICALAFVAAFTAGAASAQQPQSKPSTKPTAKPAAKAAPAKKGPAEVAPPTANDEQVKLAKSVHTGSIACELGQSINVSESKYPGYVNLAHGKQAYTMKPVMSSTGAIRLEDVKGVALMLQLGNKSMLMNTKTGQRMVDSCEHAKQKEAMDAYNKAKAEGKVQSVFEEKK
jgi:hypothetical protein